MAQTIKLKRSGTQNAVPSTSQLALGEVALNTYDGKMYIKKSVGGSESIVEIGGDATSSSGLDFTGNLNLADDVRIVIGDGNDLQIYHDGSASYIKENGTGDLIIQGSNTLRLQGSSNQELANFSTGGAVTLFHNGSVKLATTSTGIDVTGVITTDGMTTSADINFGDNDKAVFGAGSDLQIYHDGSQSVIYEGGTGPLHIRSNSETFIQNGGGTETLAHFGNNGAVTLYYDNAAKLATTSTGIDVTGTVTADGVTVGDTSSAFSGVYIISSTTGESELRLGDTDTDAGSVSYTNSDDTMTFRAAAGARMSLDSSGLDVTGTVVSDGLRFGTATDHTIKWGSGAEILGIGSADQTIHIRLDPSDASNFGYFQITDGSSDKRLLLVDDSGDISFYEDTGTSAKFFWDASGEVLGIGTTSASASYSIDAVKGIRSSGAAPNFTLQETDSSNQTWLMASYGGNFAVRDTTVSGTTYPFQIEPATPTSTLYLDSTGNVGIGDITPSYKLDVNGTGRFTGAVTLDSTLSVGNITTTGYLRGPSTFTIDPAAHGDNTGNRSNRG